MREKLRKLPYPGLRNIKTAIAATFCVVLYTLIGRPGVALACITVFICMQESVDKALRVSVDRGLGTLLGGAFGLGAAMLLVYDQSLLVLAALIFVGIVLFIFLFALFKMEGTIAIGLATFVIVTIGPEFAEITPLSHAIVRVTDTMVGIVVAFLVNALLFRPRPERFRGHTAANPVFHYERRKSSHYKTVKWDGGYTWEMYIYPEDAIDENLDFDFRAALTMRLTESGVYRKFPGYKRQVMLLDGDLHVTHRDHHDIILGQYEQDVSMGDWASEYVGKGTELSLLTRDQCAGELKLLYCGDKLELDNGQFTSFYSLTDGAKLRFTNQGKVYKEELARGDYVIVSWFQNGEDPYTVEIRHREKETTGPVALMISCRYREEDFVSGER